MRIQRATYFNAAALLYAVGLGVITLTPISEWRFIPEPPWGYLAAGWPRFWTGFDLLVNLMAYIPLGLLISRAFNHQRQGAWAPFYGFIAASLMAIALSILLEGLQTYLPSRRASIMDVTANGLGAAIGAFFASLYAQRQSRVAWPQESVALEISGLGLCVLWFLAQAAPQSIWLGLGNLISDESLRPALSWFSSGLQSSASSSLEAFAAQRILVEALCVASGLLSLGLIVHLALLNSARLSRWYQARHWMATLIAVVVLTIGIRGLWVTLLLSPGALSAWFTSGVQAGVILALLSAFGLAGIRAKHQRRAAILGILAMVFLANSAPENRYAADLFGAWSRGRWLNLQGLANLSAAIWPYAALIWLGIAAGGARSLARFRD